MLAGQVFDQVLSGTSLLPLIYASELMALGYRHSWREIAYFMARFV